MCGRIVWFWDEETQRLIAKFDDKALDDPALDRVLDRKRFNVPPSSHLPFIVGKPEGAQVEVARWGFPIPQRPNGVFNTRIESAFESPMWRGLIGKHHAILPVKGFYEWRKPDKVPHFVTRDDGRPMLLGAVAGHRDVKGEQKLCASVVTCGPSRQMEPLHDRMSIILEESDADAWLHADAQTTLDLAVPAGDVLKIYAVDDRVNSTREDDEGLIAPRKQQSLF